MPPRLVVCHCCATGKAAYAVCEKCQAIKERDEVLRLLENRGLAAPQVQPSYDAIIATYNDLHTRQVNIARAYTEAHGA